MLDITVLMFGPTRNIFCWLVSLSTLSVNKLVNYTSTNFQFLLICIIHLSLWQNRKGFPLIVSGVPPDAFSEAGQLWGRSVLSGDQIVKKTFLLSEKYLVEYGSIYIVIAFRRYTWWKLVVLIDFRNSYWQIISYFNVKLSIVVLSTTYCVLLVAKKPAL